MCPASARHFSGPSQAPATPTACENTAPIIPSVGEFGDSWLARRLHAGGDPAHIQSDYMALDIARAGRLDRRLEMALDSQRALESGTSYDFAGIIATHFRSERLFKTPFHAEGRIMRHMLAGLLEDLDAPDAPRVAVQRYMNIGFFAAKEVPLHPGTIAHFGLSWAPPGMEFRFLSETMMSFEEWVARFLRCEAYPAVSAGVEAALQGQPNAEALLQQATAVLPDSPLVAYAHAVMARRAGRNGEALAMLQSLAERFTELPNIDGHLSECHVALGQDADAEIALRREVARSPHLRGLHLRLAAMLDRLGRVSEAAEARQNAAVLSPAIQAIK